MGEPTSVIKYRSSLVIGDTVSDRSYDDGTRCWNIDFNLGGEVLTTVVGAGWKIPIMVPLGEGDVLDSGVLSYTLTTRHRVKLSNISFWYKPFQEGSVSYDYRLSGFIKVRLEVGNDREELYTIHDDFIYGDRVGVRCRMRDVSDFIVNAGENVYLIFESPVKLTSGVFTKYGISFHCSVKLDSDISRFDL